MKKIAHLHLHTEYSFGESSVKIKEIFDACKRKGISAVAITDNGNMYGVMEFLRAAVDYTDSRADFYEFMGQKRKFKVKPIVGCELQLSGGFGYFVLLCKNEEGYHNLIRLVSKNCTDRTEKFNCFDFNEIEKNHDGLICLYGGVEHYEQIKKLKCIFGEDLYLEIQNHCLQEDGASIQHAISISKKLGIKLIATNAVSYIEKKDAEIQRVLTAISSARESGDRRQVSDEHYLKSYEEMQEVLPDLQEALDNTIEVANKCDSHIISKIKSFPKYPLPEGQQSKHYLRRLTADGLRKRYANITEEIEARADYELSVIAQKDFTDYFLIAWDCVNYAISVGIPIGTGRGTACGSIVAYALGITQVDPIKNELIFERFINPENNKMPDIDFDFGIGSQQKVVEYLREKYGKACVSNTVVFGTYSATVAVKDVCRVYGIPYETAQEICGLLSPDIRAHTIKELLCKDIGHDGCLIKGNKKLITAYESNLVVKNVLDVASRIEGMPKSIRCHATKQLFTNAAVNNYVPTALIDEGTVVTQYDCKACEGLGLIGYDFLVLNCLTEIKNRIDEVHAECGKKIDFTNCNYDDPAVYDYIASGNTEGVFQFETSSMKNQVMAIKPTRLEDIIAITSLHRPRLISALTEYRKNRREENPEYLHDSLKPILSGTYGILIYQEQVIRIFHDLAGYTIGDADNIRRLLCKKVPEDIAAARKEFVYGSSKVKGCINNGIPEDVAINIFEWLRHRTPYAFLKSHATAYAQLTYQTAYLNCYYPL